MKYKVNIENQDAHFATYKWVTSTPMIGDWNYERGESYTGRTVTWYWEFTDAQDALICKLKFG